MLLPGIAKLCLRNDDFFWFVLVYTVLFVKFLQTPLIEIEATEWAVVWRCEPKLIIVFIKSHAADGVFVIVVQQGVLVLNEVSVENLTVSATREALLKSRIWLNRPNWVLMKHAKIQWYIIIIASIVPYALPLSKVPQLHLTIWASS